MVCIRFLLFSLAFVGKPKMQGLSWQSPVARSISNFNLNSDFLRQPGVRPVTVTVTVTLT
jgi:hypothetical protein